MVTGCVSFTSKEASPYVRACPNSSGIVIKAVRKHGPTNFLRNPHPMVDLNGKPLPFFNLLGTELQKNRGPWDNWKLQASRLASFVPGWRIPKATTTISKKQLMAVQIMACSQRETS